MSHYSEAFKAKVLATYKTEGPSEAARRHGVAKRSVQNWAKAAGACTEAATKSSTEAACNALASRRARLKEKLALRAEEMIDRMGDEYETVMVVAGKIGKATLSKPPARECQALATAAGILIDKLRIEGGEATERTETITIDKLDAEIERLERELAEQA